MRSPKLLARVQPSSSFTRVFGACAGKRGFADAGQVWGCEVRVRLNHLLPNASALLAPGGSKGSSIA